ncbi:embryo-specific protein ATS3A [Cryptomeria japonica]|uniref:embryo-specific protein ATS3A n=1 Tax=Cryptomeria japonica TaxID=3369 RepID=UPI0027DA7A8B|nr:embryo-specific protein ATS3A [Cryptomeria japonica]
MAKTRRLPLFEFMVFLLLNLALLKPICAAQEGKCSYTLEVETESKGVFDDDQGTKDPVHVMFQDKNGTKVLKQHMNEGKEDIFLKPGKKDMFNMSGPCLEGDVCYLFFKVEGTDGWKLKKAIVHATKKHTFHFKKYLTEKAWDGKDWCKINEQLASHQSIDSDFETEENEDESNKPKRKKQHKPRPK